MFIAVWFVRKGTLSVYGFCVKVKGIPTALELAFYRAYMCAVL